MGTGKGVAIITSIGREVENELKPESGEGVGGVECRGQGREMGKEGGGNYQHWGVGCGEDNKLKPEENKGDRGGQKTQKVR